jgi:hypothetical protein
MRERERERENETLQQVFPSYSYSSTLVSLLFYFLQKWFWLQGIFHTVKRDELEVSGVGCEVSNGFSHCHLSGIRRPIPKCAQTHPFPSRHKLCHFKKSLPNLPNSQDGKSQRQQGPWRSTTKTLLSMQECPCHQSH